MLYNILRNRLKQRANKEFVKWAAENKRNPNNEMHHIIKTFMGGKKQNDFLLAEIDHDFHTEITYKREPSESEFIDMFIPALEQIFDYIIYLQEEKK